MVETKKSSKLVIVIALVVVVAIGLGAVWWFVFRDNGKYAFSYELDGKTVSVKADDYEGVKQKLSNTPQKTGFVFGGWFFDENLTMPVTVDTFNLKANEKDSVKIYIQWIDSSMLNVDGTIPDVTYALNTAKDGMEITGLLKKSVTSRSALQEILKEV